MPAKDIRSNLLPVMALPAAVIATDTTTAGAIIDTADYDGGIVFMPFCGTYTDGTYNFLVEEGDDSGLSDAAAVPDDRLIGTEAGLALSAIDASGSVIGSIGVLSDKRYLRISAVSTSTTSGAIIGVVAAQIGEVLPVAGLSA